MNNQLCDIIVETDRNGSVQDDSLNIFNENFKFIKDQFQEKDDDDIYKKVHLKETNVTENENEDNYKMNIKEENVIEMIEYIPEKNKTLFTKKKTKRGRKKNSEKYTFECHKGKKKIEHNKFKPDNIRIKIKTHYHNFIISFFNDLIKSRFKIQRYKFRKICYSITKDVTVKNNQNLMKMTLGEFLSQNTSKKYKCEIDQNKKTYLFVKNLLKKESDKKLFDLTYWDFFLNYYMIDDKKEIINNFGIKDRTQFFTDFISNIKNTDYLKSVVNIANNHFIQYFLQIDFSQRDFMKDNFFETIFFF